jgi:hypothetical protein
MPLSKHEREQFLSEPHTAALSVQDAHDHGPLTVPVWYQYEPGGDVWVMTSVGSRKAKLIDAAGRFTLMVDQVEPRVRYVTVEGPVVDVSPATDEQLWEISSRYLPADTVPGYVEFAKAEHGEQLIYTMRPQRWLSADLTVG